jgi:hypothetical protein
MAVTVSTGNAVKRKRRRGLRLSDKAVDDLPAKRKQYVVWDISAEGCGVRVSPGGTKACIIQVRVGTERQFETIGTVAPDSPYESLRERAAKRITELKKGRPEKLMPGESTLRQAMEAYITEHPELTEGTIQDYRERFERDLATQLEQPVTILNGERVLRLNKEKLEALTASDPEHKPPRGFYSWQATLRCFRAVVRWYAAQKQRPNPWPDRRALPIKTAPQRTLPVELQSAAGRRRLIEGLKAINTATARAVMFIAYTGFRRKEGTKLTRQSLITESVLEFKSKTRLLRVPLAKQSLALVDKDSDGRLLRVTEWQLRKPLIRIFGERKTSRGKRARVTPHDMRRLFKTVGTELGIDPTVMKILVGHAIQGVDKSYIAKLRLSVLRAAVQRVVDEIENPQEVPGEDDVLVPLDKSAVTNAAGGRSGDENANASTISGYLFSGETRPSPRGALYSHYLTREELYELVWTAPVTEMSTRFGISDVGFAKACRRAAVPCPPRGYWAKVEAGHHVERPALDPAPIELPRLIRIRGTKPPPSPIVAA